MSEIDLSGSATGSGTTSGSLAVSARLQGATSGSGTVSGASLYRDLVFSGSTIGFAEVFLNPVGNFSGTTSGVGTTFAPALVRTRALSGRTGGKGDTVSSDPLPILGAGFTHGYLDLVTVLPPVLCPPAAPPTFRLGQILTRGDLSLVLTGPTGLERISPYEVSYTFYRVLSGDTLAQVGPSGRTPVAAGVGEYYATGAAGEGGQPGDWVVAWAYRRSFGAPLIYESHPFRVVDAVLGPISGDPTNRVTKYGWDS